MTVINYKPSKHANAIFTERVIQFRFQGDYTEKHRLATNKHDIRLVNYLIIN